MPKIPGHLSHPKYRPDIDGLRAVAVLSVVTFHFFPEVVKGGFIGVDIFFVISGFLISTIIFENLNQGTFSFSEFYSRRIKRIFPALIMVMISCYAFGWFALLPSEYLQLGKHIAGGSGFVSNFILWSEAGYFDNSAETKPLLHLWSLGVEEQFYILFPVAIWLAWRRNLNLFIAIGIVALASYLSNLFYIKKDLNLAFFMPYTRFWELLCGSMLAWLSSYKKDIFVTTAKRLTHKITNKYCSSAISNAASFVGFFLLLCGFWYIEKSIGFPGKWAAIPVSGAMLIIAAGHNSWVNRNILSCRIAVWFGLISFPLYLWHWPLLSFYRIVTGELPAEYIRLLLIAASILLSYITYMLVERPIRYGFKDKPIAFFLSGAVLFIGVLGYSTAHFGGLHARPTVQGFVDNISELKRSASVDPSCRAYLGELNDFPQYCRFNNISGLKTVALVGDSHAHVAFPGVSAILQSQGVNTVLLANGSCPPLLGVPYGINQYSKELCNQRIINLIDILVARKDVTHVVLFSRGEVYLTGTEPLAGSADIMGGQHIQPRDYQSGLQSTINELIHAGKEVFYVTENPELPFAPESCIQRPLKYNIRSCNISLESVLLRQKQYRNLVSGLKNVHILDSLDIFCSDSNCRVFDDNGSLLYTDDDHLSVAGSKYFAEKLLMPIIGNIK